MCNCAVKEKKIALVREESIDIVLFNLTHYPKEKEIDVRGGPCQTKRMQVDYRKRFLRVISWGLFSVWLFFGSLALAEQVNLTVETSAQDEQALSQLAAGLKTDVPHCEDCSNGFMCAEITAPAAFVSPHQVTRGLVRAVPALRLHQRVSVYRI